MEDLIKRQAAIDLLKKLSDGSSYIEIETNSAIKVFEEMPSAQPEPKTCEWCIWEDDYNNGPCRVCNRAHEDWYEEKT